uniref:2Fe-2S iron-sulfur cluster-binding protein n=1 Tax=Ectopseudomonas oleovorans TaxID=301 RepID=UPI00241D9244
SASDGGGGDVKVAVEGYPEFEATEDASLLELCEEQGIPMESACGGFACCNSCRVEVLDGAENLTEELPEEEAFLEGPAQRLGCQARVRGPVSLRLAPGA